MAHVSRRSQRACLAATMLLTLFCAFTLGRAPTPATTRGTAPSTGRITRPPATTTTRPEDWTITWERFLKRWEDGDGTTAADLFALDQPAPGVPGGKIKRADALAARGNHPERSVRLIRHMASGQKFPLKMTITVFWTVKPGGAGAPLVVTEEIFDLDVVKEKLFILDYHIADRTAAEEQTYDQRIKDYQKKYGDAKHPSDRLNAALVVAIAQIEMARIEDYWKTIRDNMPLKEMKAYPETQRRLVETLNEVAKGDAIPPAYAEIARELGFPPSKGKVATAPASGAASRPATAGN